MSKRPALICRQCSSEADTKGLCSRCYTYKKDYGKDRPARVIDEYDANGHLSDSERIARAKAKVKSMGLGKA